MAAAAAAAAATDELSMDLPIIDLDVFLHSPPGSAAAAAECAKAAAALITYGALLLHDSRVAERDNAAFLDLLEDYFAQPAAALRRDARPALGHQVGATLAHTETPRCCAAAADAACAAVVARLAPDQRPRGVTGPGPGSGPGPRPDPKCRFFWRVAEPPPYASAFPGLHAANVVPDAPHLRDRWAPAMDRWGAAMKNAVADLAEMAAVGLGLPGATFRDAGRYGPHVLAPTAADLRAHGRPGTVLAGFHTDLNFLTIHGRARYPGLHIWARNTGRRIAVALPPGNVLLVQAGRQLEHLTGGLVKAGYHEVVVTAQTAAALARRAAAAPDRPRIRVSSTFFWHLASDFELAPIPELAARARQLRREQRRLGRDEGEEPEYPPMKVGQQVESELKHIALLAS